MQIDHPHARPLDRQIVTAPGTDDIRVHDGRGRVYAEGAGPRLDFPVSGALGTHVAVGLDADGREADRGSFDVDCESEVVDRQGRFPRLLFYLKKAMFDDFHRPNNVRRVDGRVQRSFVLTSRDHVHGMKAMKYFHSVLPSWMDTFTDHQAEDGMVWDFCMPRNQQITHFETRWGEKFRKVVDFGWTALASP